MSKFYLLLFIAIFSAVVNAQKRELGNVTKAELQQAVHPFDSSASAALLFKTALTTFKYDYDKGFVATTEVSIKIKIYKKEAFDLANFQVPYYVGYTQLSDDTVKFSKAFTYNLEDGKVVKTKVTGENQFKENYNDRWKIRSITFPNVRVGSILELRYVLKSQDLSDLPEFRFQYKFPVDYASYESRIPEFYIYKAIQTGYLNLVNNAKLEQTSQTYTDKYKQTRNLQYRQIVTNYLIINVPGLIEEDYVDNINNYYGKLDHELQTIRMPEQTPMQVATTWEDVAKSVYKEDSFGKELEKYTYFENDLPLALQNKNTEAEKAEAVYAYVRDRMNWNDNFGYYTRDGVEKAYANRTGNLAEINLMLVSMLRMAGLQANPVLLSTRANGKAPFPSRLRLNAVIAGVMINNNLQMFDASYKLGAPNVLPLRDLNSTGRMIQKGGIVQEVNLMPTVISKKTIGMIATIGADGIIKGQLGQQTASYTAHQSRDEMHGQLPESFIEKLESENRIEIDNFKVENQKEPAKPLVINYDFTTNEAVEIINDKMYFSPMLFLARTENPFKQENRVYPVDFVFPFEEKYNFTLSVPDGYVVESIPAPVNLAMQRNLGTFKFNIASQGNKIQLSAAFGINDAVITSNNYEALKLFYRQMIAKQTEKIVLKKT